MFAALRKAIEKQQAALAERREAVDQAEQALSRLGQLFGLPLAPCAGAQDACEVVPVLAASTGPQTVSPDQPERAAGVCPECGGPFEPYGRRKYCSDVCRERHGSKKYRQRQKANGETLEPIREWRRPPHVPMPDSDHSDRASLAPPGLPWESV